MFKSRKLNSEIFLVSFIILFLEIALIRWISTEIRIFAYFNNLVLLACFLGLGIGCCYLDRKSSLSMTAVLLFVLIAMVNFPINLIIENHKFHIFKDAPLLLSTFTDSLVWYEIGTKATFFKIFIGFLSIFVIFFVIVFVFIPLGQILGRALERHKRPIIAYSVNIIASILGIWFFSYLSFMYSPPLAWFILIMLAISIMFLFLQENLMPNFILIVACLFLITLTMTMKHSENNKAQTIWSPYQKLEISRYIDEYADIEKGYLINVNNVGYMALLDLSENFIRKYPDYFDYNMRKFSQYDIPYLFKKDAKDVLILGAGAGNDAAGALRNGAKKICAVEIDPGIYKLGLRFHPEFPYSNPKVKIIIDDARSFFKKSKEKFDIISFGLLDAHTLSSSYNNIRLDHYVYTEESFREAKSLLKDDGLVTVIFAVPRLWLGQRIQELLHKVFNTPPLVFQMSSNNRFGLGGIMFIASSHMDRVMDVVNSNPQLNQFISRNGFDYLKIEEKKRLVKLTSDDWPYLYLEKPFIPKMHLIIIAILMVLFIIARKVLLPKGKRLDFHFFFLGAAFLLLEFQNISKTTLLFGSTWLVNAIVISAILILALCANFFVSRFKIKIKLFYLLLFFSILGIYATPLGAFNFFGYLGKSILASLILNLPIFFAGVIFTSSFRKAECKNMAFGSNIIGAAVGGILESLSFTVGINMLLLVVMVFYFLSFFFLGQVVGDT